MNRCSMISKYVLLFLVPFITVGCWDRTELNDVAVVLLSSLDERENQPGYEAVSMIEASDRTDSNGSNKNDKVMSLTLTGKTIADIQIAQDRQLSRMIMTSHRQIIIVGESLARNGIKDILDLISRNPKNRLKTRLIVARNMKGQRLVKLQYPLDPVPGEFFRESIKMKMNVPTTLREIFISSITPGIQPVAAAFSEKKEPQMKASLDSIALFKNFKLIGFVEGMEAVALNSMFGREPTGTIGLQVKGVKGTISVQVIEMKVTPQLRIQGSKLFYSMKVTVKGKIIDNQTNLDLSNPGHIKNLNKLLEKEVTQLYESLFMKLQHTYKVDSIGLGAQVYRKNPKLWKQIEKDWPDLYSEQKIEWKVNAMITGVGSAGANLFLPEKGLIN